MAGTSGAEQRLRAFYDERLAGGEGRRRAGRRRARAAAEPPPNPAEERRRLLHEVRQQAAATAAEAGRPRRRRSADRTARVPAQLPGKNWIPIGPAAVLRGQATGTPVVSGRVQDLALSRDGRRVYAATANGGVWRSLDAGDSWEPMSDEHDLDIVARQVDSLACGAMALVEGADAAHDRLYVGTGEGHSGVGGTRADTGEDIDRLRPPRRRHAALGRRWRDVGPGGLGPRPRRVQRVRHRRRPVRPRPRRGGDDERGLPPHRRGPDVDAGAAAATAPTCTGAIIDNVSGVAVARNGGRTEFYVVRRGFTNSRPRCSARRRRGRGRS